MAVRRVREVIATFFKRDVIHLPPFHLVAVSVACPQDRCNLWLGGIKPNVSRGPAGTVFSCIWRGA
jgi:hypothetical protein